MSPHCHTSLLVWLRTKHSSLNSHLWKITKSDTLDCPHCLGINEDMIHFLLSCPHYACECHQFLSQLHQRVTHIPFLLSNSKGARLVLNYIDHTGHFKPTFGDVHVSS
ncbi:hypothetical protein PAXRUDRAFT_159409 [Paxillus rubicundulus Ve08.2h10]|uniref:Reverse transcriptase zinc-binding domain-containing protein n=1 Tax=Paxillus rubicundulus Ve08.2h10 TaxID=930991 RepID=A0A0D0CX63_9AGAM|nr:hypothetical protein PAXRUDRAFT_159409 [Paxillus rubicundulus Ve08.2h10]